MLNKTAKMTLIHVYTPQQELVNSLVHGIGAVGAVAGVAILMVMASLRGTVWHIVSFSVYGSTLFALYLTSTLYHGLTSPRAKRVFEILDHSFIYLLIAGTYTPFTLVTLHGPWGWSLFGVVWGLAVVGIIYKIFFTGRHPYVSTGLYIVLGWIVLLALKPLVSVLPMGGMLLLVLGGVCYSLGTVFYHRERWYYSHAVWHLFVIAGSVFHYFAILFYVLPEKV